MADKQHVFKNRSTGAEHLLPEAFGKTKHSEAFDDLGEGYIFTDPTTGIASVKLAKEPKASVPAPEASEPESEAPKKHKK